MRHKHGYRKLNRTSSHRAALLKNLSIALTKEGRIETTLPKAKELRSYFEKLVTKASSGDLNAHRAIFAMLQHKAVYKYTCKRDRTKVCRQKRWIYKNY